MGTPGRADVLLHPVRLRIVQTLMLQPEQTVAELGRVLDDVPQASLYRHLRRLLEAGFVDVVEERPVGGAMERVYAVVPEAVNLGAADLSSATREDHRRYFTAYCIALMGSFEQYLQREHIDLVADGVGYRTTSLWLSDDEFHELVKAMNRPIREVMHNGPAPGRRKRLFASAVFPVMDSEEAASVGAQSADGPRDETRGPDDGRSKSPKER